jgi:purine-cytosine permease-like protein
MVHSKLLPTTVGSHVPLLFVIHSSPYHSIATGMAGTLSYGLSLRVASLVILLFGLLAGIPVAWMGMMGPKTGMRQMIQARYSFG